MVASTSWSSTEICRCHLLRNIVADRGNWIFFRALDTSGVDAEGTIVTLTVGGREMRRDVRAAYSYLASNSPRVHFGLGAATRVEDVVVRWIDGARESYGSFDAGQVVTLRRGAGGSGLVSLEPHLGFVP